MCGLIFTFDPQRDPAELRQRAADALNRLAHRGPDGSGLLSGPGYVIGHRRLSVIDLEGSRQPMEDNSGRHVLVFNGEIYNYRQLRNGLETRWRFKSQGDTEVLLAGLVFEGPDFLRAAEGMWALALWDREEQSLLLARDRMGKKPLYYFANKDRFVVASELPSLLRLLPEIPAEDLDSTADYLRFGYCLPGTTAYRNVQEVLPGHWLSWTPHAAVETRAYWRLKVGGYDGHLDEACVRMHETLGAAVQRRLVADVEVGSFLSGGVDSSIIVALTSRVGGRPPKTFTIGFQEAAFDERAYARLVSEHFGTDHREEVLEGLDPDALQRLVLDHVGQPFGDSSILPTALVSELASRDVKVALSGDGGDELFCGYQRYLGRVFLRWYTRLPIRLRKSFERLLRRLPEPMVHHSRSILKKAHLFLDLVEKSASERPYVAPVMYDNWSFAELVPDLAGRGHLPPMIPEECGADDIWSMMAGDALVYLPQDILVKVDRASMAASLEARAPFLDRAVVELAFSFPRRFHMPNVRGKQMLSRTFHDLLPKTIWNRRKQGFSVPLHEWFRGNLGRDLEARLGANACPLNSSIIHRMLESHRRRQRDNGHRLWQIYVYLLWREAIPTSRFRPQSTNAFQDPHGGKLNE